MTVSPWAYLALVPIGFGAYWVTRWLLDRAARNRGPGG